MTVVQFDSGLFLTGARCQATEVFSRQKSLGGLRWGQWGQ